VVLHFVQSSTIEKGDRLPRCMETRLLRSAYLSSWNFEKSLFHFYRAPWAFKKCNILNQPLFQACHLVVDPRPYFDACYHDTCGCDLGGDCECLCTAVGAYAQACSSYGVHIKWRSQEFCRKFEWWCLGYIHIDQILTVCIYM